MREEKTKKVLIYVGATILLIFCLFPFIWMLIVSVSQSPAFLSPNTTFQFTLENYKEILFNESLHFVDYLKNSFIISLVAAVCTTFFTSISAYAITRLKFPGRGALPLILLAFSMFPQISIVGYLFRLMTNLGWINSYPALIFPYITIAIPLALWIMMSYLKQIPIELDNAALVDGANRFQILRKIIFPLAAPGAFSTFLLIFIFCFNEFLFTLMLTVDHNACTIPVGIALFQGLHGEIPWGEIMAASAIASIPLIILAAIFQRHIIQGLTRGALKE